MYCDDHDTVSSLTDLIKCCYSHNKYKCKNHVVWYKHIKLMSLNRVLSSNNINYLVFTHLREIALCNENQIGYYQLSKCGKYLKHFNTSCTKIFDSVSVL